jgi:hypothetical protein
VLPYKNRRFNGTYGGPLRKDLAHYFVYYERESEPSTITFNSPYPSFNIDQTRDVLDWNGGARLDFQVGSQQHLMLRGTKWHRTDPAYAGLNGATSHPSAQGYSAAQSDTFFATFSKVLGNRGLNVASKVCWERSSVSPGAMKMLELKLFGDAPFRSRVP